VKGKISIETNQPIINERTQSIKMNSPNNQQIEQKQCAQRNWIKKPCALFAIACACIAAINSSFGSEQTTAAQRDLFSHR
jgi:hypothetical protein